MRHATVIMLFVTGVVTLCAVFDGAAGQAVCVHCVCPPSYSPVCGFREKTKTLRGFPSRCVLECSNKCRKNKYEFVFNGRCGKYSPSTTTEITSSTMAYARSADNTSIVAYAVTEAADNTTPYDDTEAAEDLTTTYADTTTSSSTTSPEATSSVSGAPEDNQEDQPQSSGYRGVSWQSSRRSRPRSRFVASR